MSAIPEDFPKLTAKQLRRKRAEIRQERQRVQKEIRFWKGANRWLKNRKGTA